MIPIGQPIRVIKKTFNITRPMSFLVNSAGLATNNDFTADLNQSNAI